ncbi:hypothetical protein [Rhizosphaericola mali]|uniref:Uncharacterized protein n=1 Tax=Rhizosphaericola mali TaxID=2545455 RepID=A0A5P2FZN7_9BACT|nr:hypothetical protein [Rhizosphaericola mali]QES88685.1 hypothetical protein E0W69_008480 [Rhizosphaericola mali]
MKKKNKDHYHTYIWNFNIIKDPYRVIAEIFFMYSLDVYRKHIKVFLLLAVKYEKIKCKDLTMMIDLLHSMRSLILAADSILSEANNETIVKSFSVRDEAICVCKTLTESELSNPFKVLAQFFKYKFAKKWCITLDDILDYAFSQFDYTPDYDLLPIYILLNGFIEANFLINTRINQPSTSLINIAEMETKNENILSL